MCYSRYQRLKEEKKQNWKIEEERKIQELVALFGKKWQHLSEFIPSNYFNDIDRSPKQIR